MVIESMRLSVDKMHLADEPCHVSGAVQKMRNRFLLKWQGCRVVEGSVVMRVQAREQ